MTKHGIFKTLLMTGSAIAVLGLSQTAMAKLSAKSHHHHDTRALVAGSASAAAAGTIATDATATGAAATADEALLTALNFQLTGGTPTIVAAGDLTAQAGFLNSGVGIAVGIKGTPATAAQITTLIGKLTAIKTKLDAATGGSITDQAAADAVYALVREVADVTGSLLPLASPKDLLAKIQASLGTTVNVADPTPPSLGGGATGTIDAALLTSPMANVIGLTGSAGSYTMAKFDANGNKVAGKTITITDAAVITEINNILNSVKPTSDAFMSSTEKTAFDSALATFKPKADAYVQAIKDVAQYHADLNKLKDVFRQLGDKKRAGTSTPGEDRSFDRIQHMLKPIATALHNLDRKLELASSKGAIPATPPTVTKRDLVADTLSLIAKLDTSPTGPLMATTTAITAYISALPAYKAALAPYLASAKKAAFDTEMAKVRRIASLLSSPTAGKPVVGTALSETVRDSNAVSQELALRRSEKMTGIWFSGNMPFAEDDKKFNHNLKTESTNAHFTLGYDQIVNKQIAAGGFFSYADNEVKSKNNDLNQDKSSFNFGAYGLYTLDDKLYVADKISYNHNSYDNKLNYSGFKAKSSFDFNSWSNELTAGFRMNPDFNIEGYWNILYANGDDFVEKGQTTGTASTAIKLDTKVSFDKTFYNSIGARAFYMLNKPISETFKFQPYAQSFIEVALSGKELEGKYTTSINGVAQKTIKDTFEEFDAVTYGVTAGFMYQPEQMSDFKFNVAYQLTHFANTAHAINVTGNWSL